MEMEKVDCSGCAKLESVPETFGGGTGMYEVIRCSRACFWIWYSGRGPSAAWMLTAKPWKQGMAN
jgi:hypothetical protein